jgi:hypothetical protein
MSLSNQKNDLKQGCWYCAIFTMAMKLLMKNRNCHCHQIGNIKKIKTLVLLISSLPGMSA